MSLIQSIRLPFAVLKFPPELMQAVGLFLVSTFVRSLGVCASLALAAYVGTGIDMDRYMAFTMVVATMCALATAALPVAVARRVAQGPGAEVICRRWGRQVRWVALSLYVVACPILAWLFTPASVHDGGKKLLVLLLIGLPSVYCAALTATEQSLLQSKGHVFKAVWSSGLFSACGLLAVLLSGFGGGLYLCAAGSAIGAMIELVWLKRLNAKFEKQDQAQESPAPAERLPWRMMLSVLGASSGSLLLGFYDQALLAQLGEGAQATWGLATRFPSFFTMGLFGMAGVMCTATLPKAQQQGSLRLQTWKLAAVVLCFSTLSLGLVAVTAQPLTRVFYERGAFLHDDTVRVAEVLQWAVFAYVWYPMSNVLIRATGMTSGYRMLLWSAALYIGVRVSCATVFTPLYGMPALALSTFAGSLAQVLLLVYAVHLAGNKAAAGTGSH